jgi:diguanylate cyclase (GGDEF)-like protein/PAS domain S-box-containing protein
MTVTGPKKTEIVAKAALFEKSVLANEQQTIEFVTSFLEASTEYSIIGVDLNGAILLWNEGARKLYGYEAGEVVGKANASILHTLEGVAAGKPREVREAALRDGRWEGTIQRRRKNGEQFTARVVLTPRLDAARKAIGFLLISKDISEEMRFTTQLESTNRELRAEADQRRRAENSLIEAHHELRHRTKELEQHASQMKLLAEMGELLQTCVNLAEAGQVMELSLRNLFPSSAGAVYLNRELGGIIEALARWNNSSVAVRETLELQDCWGLRRGRVHVSRLMQATRCAHLKEMEKGEAICVPMMGHGQSLGMLHVVWSESDPEDTSRAASRERLAQAAADTIALAIANVTLREQLREQTIRDPLTKLYNRRYLEDALSRELSRARRAETSVGIIMLDVDDFKRFNDTHGHPMGDELLRALGEHLKSHVRPEDIPCRYGGEEFTLIMPGASIEIVRERAEKLRGGFKELRLSHGAGVENLLATTSLSCGVAVFPEHGANLEQVLRAADAALYEAKKGGKDRVITAVSEKQSAAQTQAEPVRGA